MNDILVLVFRSIFGFVAWSLIFGCMLVGGVMVVSGSPAPAFVGWLVLIGGPVLIITLAGTVAVMIQNNDLLRQIADRESKQSAATPANSPATAVRREPKLRQ